MLKIEDAGKCLDKMIAEGQSGKMDMVLIDCDHKNIEKNFEKCLKLVRPNGLIAVCRTFMNGLESFLNNFIWNKIFLLASNDFKG